MKKIVVYGFLILFTVSLKAQDCANGTLLFKEDFGGNDVSDPSISTYPIISMSSGYRQNITGNFPSMSSSRYIVAKKGYANGDTTLLSPYLFSQWYIQDDHTYPKDYTRGYFLEVDGAGGNTHVFYETEITDLCPSAKLSFSAYIANVFTWFQNDWYEKNRGPVVDPNLSFVISDLHTNIELARYNTGDILPDINLKEKEDWRKSSEWHYYGIEFSLPLGISSVRLSIINNVLGGIGNDFALDDIEIRLCIPSTTISMLPNDTVCNNERVTLTGQFTNDGTFTEPLIYKWFKSATASYNQSDWTEITTGQTLTISSAQSSDTGFYRVAVASAGSIDMVNCRSMSDIVSLTVQDCPASPLVVSEDTTICSGSSVELEASGAVSYSWSPATGLSSTVIANPVASPTTTTTYTVTGTFVDNSTLSASVTVSVLASTTTVLKDTICLNDSYTEHGFNLPIQTESGEKKYSLRLLSQNGCDSIVQLNLQVLPEYETVRQVFIEHGESIQIDNQTYSFPTEVISRYASVSGCDSVAVTTIRWKEGSSECDELIPDKYFSPNNDGVQDAWNIKNIECYDGYVVEIYDRFSKLLIHYNNDFIPWNGMYLGGPMPTTDYWYLITLKDGSQFTGHFTLKR